MSSALAFIGAYSDEQPRDKNGCWTNDGAFESTGTFDNGRFTPDLVPYAHSKVGSIDVDRELAHNLYRQMNRLNDIEGIDVISTDAGHPELAGGQTSVIGGTDKPGFNFRMRDVNDGESATRIAKVLKSSDTETEAGGMFAGSVRVNSTIANTGHNQAELRAWWDRTIDKLEAAVPTKRGLERELAFIGAWSPDQARDEQGRWTDGSGAIHYSGLGGHFSVKQQYQTDVHEVRVHGADGVRTVREYRDSYMAHAHAVQAAKGLRLAEGIQFVGAEFDEEKHPRDEKGQWTAGDTFNYDEKISPYNDRQPSDRISKIQLAPIDQIETTETLQKSDEKYLGDMVDSMKKGDPFHALIVEFSHDTESGNGDVLSVVDGHHRLEAAKRLGYKTVPVRVKVSEDDWPGVKKGGGLKIRVGAAGDPSPYKLSKFAAQHAAELVDAPKKERDAIRDEVRKALKNGEGPSGIADRLYGEIDKTPEEIDRIAQTEYVIARTGAKLEQFDAAAGDDADAGKQWVLGETEHCPTCVGLAGQTVPLGEPFVTADGEEFDGPPAHPNCDCDVEEADLSKTQARAAVEFIGAQT